MEIKHFLSEEDKIFLGNTQINKIEEKYRNIDDKWLKLHYQTTIYLVAFAFLAELIIGIYLMRTDMLSTTRDIFIWKFILIPSGLNFMLVFIERIVFNLGIFKQKTKIYIASLMLVGICLTLFTVHITFAIIYGIFLIAIIMTIVYADYRLTSLVSFLSMVGLIISELFIVWDLDKISIFQSANRMGNFLSFLFFLLAFYVACMVIIKFENEKNITSILIEIERYKLEEQLNLDQMTGLRNKKALHSMLDLISLDEDNEYTLVISDIDRFKYINDNFGHYVGDICIHKFAEILKSYSEEFSAFRYGGDEFCIIFKNKNDIMVETICKDIQNILESVDLEQYPNVKINASFGIAKSSKGTDGIKLFIKADRALYEAKKNRGSIFMLI
ncbi:MAG: diguanylate cyclase [Proteocatella sp.]